MKEDSQQQEKTVSVNGIKIIALILVSAVLLMILKVIVLLPTSPLIIEQVTRGCVVEIEDTRKETHNTCAFYPCHHQNQDLINSYYADGLLMTYSNPHQHIWTNAATY